MLALRLFILLAFILLFAKSNHIERINLSFLKPAALSPSSYDEEGEAGRAIDALTSTESVIESTRDPWWSVDLVFEYFVQEVRLRSRFYGRSSTSKVDVLLHKEIPHNILEVINEIDRCGSGDIFTHARIMCPPVDKTYRLVLLTVSGVGQLIIGDVFVYGNHFRLNQAFSKIASMSSIDLGYDSKLAVDGSLKTCSKTEANENAWWSVDLGAPYRIEEVIIHHSGNKGTRLMVYVSNEEEGGRTGVGLVECGDGTGGLVKCSSELGHRYVAVRAKGEPGTVNQSVELCEVQVYERKVWINHAWFKRVSQASAHSPSVDMDESTCTLSEVQREPWWSLDMGGPHTLNRVEIKGEITGDEGGSVTSRIVIYEMRNSIYAWPEKAWEGYGPFWHTLEPLKAHQYQYFKLEVEGTAGLKICHVTAIENNFQDADVGDTPVKGVQVDVGHFFKVIVPVIGTFLFGAALGFIGWKVWKKRGVTPPVVNGNSPQVA